MNDDDATGCVRVVKGEENDPLVCRQCRRVSTGLVLIVDGSGVFDSIVVCEACMVVDRSSPDPVVTTIVDSDDGIVCDRCQAVRVGVPVFAFDLTGNGYDALVVCDPCVRDLFARARIDVLNDAMNSMCVDRRMSDG